MAKTAELTSHFAESLLPSDFRYSDVDRTVEAAVKGVSAVLILLRQDGVKDDWQVLFTVRSKTMRRHPGEVCFPGGMREPTDETPVDTALREADEEIGLLASDVEVVGTLLPIVNRLAVRIYPVLAVLKSNRFTSELKLSTEVEHIFWAPLDRFLSRRRHGFFQIEDNFRIHVFMLERPVFGVTALLAILIAVGVYDQRPDFVGVSALDESTGDPPRRQIATVLTEYGQLRPAFDNKAYAGMANLIRRLPVEVKFDDVLAKENAKI